MNTETRRVTVNLPSDLLDDAMATTKKGITETLAEGLRLLQQRRFGEKALALKGAINLDLDLDDTRERRRR